MFSHGPCMGHKEILIMFIPNLVNFALPNNMFMMGYHGSAPWTVFNVYGGTMDVAPGKPMFEGPLSITNSYIFLKYFITTIYIQDTLPVYKITIACCISLRYSIKGTVPGAPNLKKFKSFVI